MSAEFLQVCTVLIKQRYYVDRAASALCFESDESSLYHACAFLQSHESLSVFFGNAVDRQK